MDGYTTQVIALWVLGGLVIGWVLYSLVSQVVAAVRTTKQGHQPADTRPRWGAEDVPTFAQSRARPPAD